MTGRQGVDFYYSRSLNTRVGLPVQEKGGIPTLYLSVLLFLGLVFVCTACGRLHVASGRITNGGLPGWSVGSVGC